MVYEGDDVQPVRHEAGVKPDIFHVVIKKILSALGVSVTQKGASQLSSHFSGRQQYITIS